MPEDTSDSLLTDTAEASPAGEATATAEPQTLLTDTTSTEETQDTAPADRPEFLLEKYSSVEDQAKAYPELQKQFGAFTGAPESYEVTVPEGITAEIDTGSPLIQDFSKLCSENRVSQDFFNEVTDLFFTSVAAENAISQSAEMEKLGAEGPQKIGDLMDWAKANFDEDQMGALERLCTTAEAVELFSELKNKMLTSQSVASETAKPVEQIDKLRLEQMVGDPRYTSDEVYRREVQQAFERFYGNGSG